MEQEVAKTDGAKSLKAQARIARTPRPQAEELYSEGKFPSSDERRAAGKALRNKVPLDSHAQWKEPADRRDPIDILIGSNKGRLTDLVPIRHGRMLTSPFAFPRGSAAGMARTSPQPR